MSDPNIDDDTDRLNSRELVESPANSAEQSSRYKFARLLRGNVTRKSWLIALVALLTVTAVAVSVPLHAAADDHLAHASAPEDGDDANETVTAGEHLSGSLSVQQESVDRNISQRAVTVAVETAPTDGVKAHYLTGECEQVRQTVQALKQRASTLQRARDNGSISTGEFRARMTELDARAETVEQLSETCLRNGRTISNESLSRSGFNVTAMRESRRTATTFRREELSGHTLNLTGRNVSLVTAVGFDVLTNDSLENVSTGQREQLAEASTRRELIAQQNESAAAFVAEHDPEDEDAAEALSCAGRELAAAEKSIEAARRAAEAGDDDVFSDRIAAAREQMDTAEVCIERAYEEVGP